MSKKKLWVGAALTALTLVLPYSGGAQLEHFQAAEAVIAGESGTIVPMRDDLVWYYKTENGKKYRRLYNKTTKKWLTDWILCS